MKRPLRLADIVERVVAYRRIVPEAVEPANLQLRHRAPAHHVERRFLETMVGVERDPEPVDAGRVADLQRDPASVRYGPESIFGADQANLRDEPEVAAGLDAEGGTDALAVVALRREELTIGWQERPAVEDLVRLEAVGRIPDVV